MYGLSCLIFEMSAFLFVCLGLTSLWNIWGHITTVPACSSGTLTIVLPHRNTMPQTQDMTPHPVTVYRHGANLSLCYPSMWNVTLEYTATHFNVLGEIRPGNPSPTFHTHQRTFNLMLSWWSTVGSSVESTVPTGKCQKFQDMGEGFLAWIFKNRLERYPDFYICYEATSNDYSYKIWEKSDNYLYVFYLKYLSFGTLNFADSAIKMLPFSNLWIYVRWYLSLNDHILILSMNWNIVINGI